MTTAIMFSIETAPDTRVLYLVAALIMSINMGCALDGNSQVPGEGHSVETVFLDTLTGCRSKEDAVVSAVVVADSQGAPHIIYYTDENIRYFKKHLGRWVQNCLATKRPGIAYGLSEAQLKITREGEVLSVWTKVDLASELSQIVCSTKKQSGEWDLERVGAGHKCFQIFPRLSVTRDSSPSVVYVERETPNVGRGILKLSVRHGKAWETETVAPSGCFPQDFVYDKGGVPHVCATEKGGLYHYWRDIGGWRKELIFAGDVGCAKWVELGEENVCLASCRNPAGMLLLLRKKADRWDSKPIVNRGVWYFDASSTPSGEMFLVLYNSENALILQVFRDALPVASRVLARGERQRSSVTAFSTESVIHACWVELSSGARIKASLLYSTMDWSCLTNPEVRPRTNDNW